MKQLTLKKNIIVPYNGYIPLKGINGPITVPYMETYQNIAKLLMARMPVMEVLTDGTKVPLNLNNYDKENSWNASSTEKKYEAVYFRNGQMRSGKKPAGPIIVTDDDVKASSMETLLDKSVKGTLKRQVEPKKTTSSGVTITDGSTKVYESKQVKVEKKKAKKQNEDEIFDAK